jgi:iron complex outermembrane receptor protein
MTGFPKRWLTAGSLVTTFVLAAGSVAAQPAGGSAAGSPVDASSIVPPTLVFAASRQAETLAQAPALVTVITREEIEVFGWRTLGDILASCSSFLITYDRNYTYPTERGLGRLGDLGTRILLMVNGHRLNGGVDDAAGIGSEAAIDMNSIERVEILRGPGSVLYGTNAVYAVVNVVTRSGTNVNGAEVEAEASNFATYRGGLELGWKNPRGSDFFAAASAMKTRGPDLYFPEFDDPATNYGRAVGVDGDEAAYAYAQYHLGDFLAQASYSSRTKTIPTASFDTIFNDPRAFTRDRVATAGVSYEHAFADLSRAWTSLFYNNTHYNGGYPYPGFVTRDYLDAEVYTLEGQYLRYVGNHTLTLGGEFRRNARLDQGVYNDYDDQSREYVLQDHRSSSVWALFGQGQFRLSERAALSLGLRYDQYETFGGTANPSVALVVSLAAESSLKFLYGRAFRAPNSYDLYYEDGGVTQKPSPDLQPETADTFEIAIEQRLGPQLRGSAALYRINASNLITLTTDPSDGLLVYRNADRMRSTGVELELTGRLTGPLNGRISYSYQDAIDEGTGAVPPNSPLHLGYAGLWAALPHGLGSAALQLHYLGTRAARDGSPVDPYTVVDFYLRLRPWSTRALELTVGSGNLLDTAHGDPGGEEHVQRVIPRDGRVYRVGVRMWVEKRGEQ